MNGHGTHTMGTMVGDDGDPGRQPDRRRPARQVDLGKGLLPRHRADLVRASGSSRPPTRPETTPALICGRTSSTTRGAAAPATRSSSPPCRRGSHRASSRRSRTATKARGCGTAGSPGDLPETYAAGASTSERKHRVASHPAGRRPSAGSSSRTSRRRESTSAPQRTGATRRTGRLSGTSMASPHVAGTVALIWSISPELRGDIARTEQLLDQTATDVDNTTCGGDCGRQQRLGRGQAQRACCRDRGADRPDRNALRNGSPQPTTWPRSAGAEVHVTGPGNRGVGTEPDRASTRCSFRSGRTTVTVTAHGYATQTVIERRGLGRRRRRRGTSI